MLAIPLGLAALFAETRWERPVQARAAVRNSSMATIWKLQTAMGAQLPVHCEKPGTRVLAASARGGMRAGCLRRLDPRVKCAAGTPPFRPRGGPPLATWAGRTFRTLGGRAHLHQRPVTDSSQQFSLPCTVAGSSCEGYGGGATQLAVRSCLLLACLLLCWRVKPDSLKRGSRREPELLYLSGANPSGPRVHDWKLAADTH